MRRVTSIILVLLAAASAPAVSQASITHLTSNSETPLVGMRVPVPCTGESITFTQGALHDLFVLTVSDTRFSVTIHDQPHALRGVDGTGHRYVGVGITREHDSGSFVNGAAASSFVNTFDMVGLAGAPSYRTHETAHVTITPEGAITVDRVSLRVSCGS
jgi:hypothetical protein